MGLNSLMTAIEELKASAVNLGRQASDATLEKWDAMVNEAAQESKIIYKTIRRKPYWFLAGSLGLGIAIGKMFSRKTNRN